MPVSVTSLTVAPATDTLLATQTVQLAATPKDANGAVLAGRAIAWTASDTSIATVSGTGLVTARRAGTASVSATVEGKSATASIVVRPLPVVSVTVTPTAATLDVGDTITLVARTLGALGDTLSGRAVVWTFSAPDVATVSAGGVVTAVGAGVATIMAASEGKTATATISVNAPTPLALHFVDDVLVTGPRATAVLRVADASGTPVPASALTVTVQDYVTQAPDARVQVSGDGTIRQQGDLGDRFRAFRLLASYQGQRVPGVVMVVAHATDRARVVFPSQHWRLIVPGDWIAQATSRVPDFALALDLGWQVEHDLMGATAEEAWNAAAPGITPAVPFQAIAEDSLVCGASGNPIRFARGCFFDRSGDPQWHFLFHEMGHNTTIAQLQRAIFCQMMCGDAQNRGAAWVEGEANLFGLYVLRALGASPQLSAATRQSILLGTQYGFGPNSAFFLQALAKWEATTGPFDQTTAGGNEFIWNGIEVRLANEFGWDYVPRYVRAWRNDPAIRSLMKVDAGGTTPTSRMTFAAAALSASVKQDLRDRFMRWRFTIDDALFTAVYNRLLITMDTPYGEP